VAKKQLIGTVVSDKMQKTVVVSVEILKKIKKYGKVVKRNKKYKAHYEIDLKVGDKVVIESSRPYSKEKRWKVLEVIGKK